MNQQFDELIEFIDNGIAHFDQCMNDEKWLRINNLSKEKYAAKKEAFQVVRNYIEALKFNQ